MLLSLIAAARAASPSAPGDVTFTEFQSDTDRVPQYYGEWFELRNNTPGTLDFNGVSITRSSGSTITINTPTLLAAGDHLVLGVSDNQTYGDADFNGNVPIDYLYSFASFNLSATSDTVTVEYGGTVLDEVAWDASWGAALDYAHAASLNAHDLEWANDFAVNWCSSATFITVSGMYGSPGAANEYCGSSAGVDNDGDGFSERDGDCRDDDENIHPGSVDGNDGVPQVDGGGGDPDDDANCDGVRDDGVVDADGDGYSPADGDCDDAQSAVFPGAVELADGVDNDCNDCVDDLDEDRDGYGASTESCGADCDDTNDAIHPGATESCNGADDDCDGELDEGGTSVWYTDEDGDGYGGSPVEACEQPGGTVDNALDCDDADPLAWSGAEEVCDAADNDCDDRVDEDEGVARYDDADADGVGSGEPLDVCHAGGVESTGDCDDGDATRFPGNAEVCDARDNDCDESTYDPIECGGDTGTDEEPEKAACGCGSALDASAAPALLGFLALRRSRRRPTPRRP